MTAGTLSAETLTKAYLARIALTNAEGPALQAVRSLNTNAVEEAKLLDRERATSGVRGPLHGIPVLLDDVIDAKGLPTTGGSIALQKSMPGSDAALVSKLKAAGAIILGKTNVSELNGALRRQHARGLLVARRPGAAAVRHRQDPGRFGRRLRGRDRRGPGGADRRPRDLDRQRADHRPGGCRGRGRAEADGRPGLERRRAAGREVPGRRRPDRQDGVRRGPGPRRADGRQLRRRPHHDRAGGQEGRRDLEHHGAVPGRRHRRHRARRDAVTKTVGTPSPNTASIINRSFEKDLNAYLAGTSGGAGSLQGIVNYNTANPVEGLKYQQGQLTGALSPDLSALSADIAAGKASNAAVIDALLADTDVIMVPSGNALVNIADRAGYPVLTVPAGYGTGGAGRNPIGVTFVGKAGTDAALLAAGYAYEQATNVRQAPSFTNPSMFRCVSGEHVLLAAPLPPGRSAERVRVRADRDAGAGRRRWHGAGDARR